MVREYSFIKIRTNSSSFHGMFLGIQTLIVYRKAKDYTYLYGESLHDEDSSLTRHLKNAFVEGCREYIPSETVLRS